MTGVLYIITSFIQVLSTKINVISILIPNNSHNTLVPTEALQNYTSAQQGDL